MAIHTPIHYRNQLMYSVFVRNFSPEGTFAALCRELPRIRELGVDIIWLMPIHPIGKQARKGTVGSPYAISDYRKIDPSLGSVEDLKSLVSDIHALDMKCIIDVVYNHTSPDSWLAQHHPEWFYRKPDGSFGNRVGDWTDIIDLDYSNRALWDYQIETLKYWAGIVDGFRCDVAPLVPLEFWLEARGQVEQVRPGCIWLAESVEPEFIAHLRARGVTAHSDGELYQAFDICYDYDIFNTYRDVLTGKQPLEVYARAVMAQETMYPANYVKLRFLENHDRPRAAQAIRDPKAMENWLAFTYFQRGMPMLFAGQEVGADHLPQLFEKDPVDWNGSADHTPLLKKLRKIKADPLMADSTYTLKALPRDVLLAVHEKEGRKLVGIFSTRGEASYLEVDLPDGTYQNLLGGTAQVHEGKVATDGVPMILKQGEMEI